MRLLEALSHYGLGVGSDRGIGGRFEVDELNALVLDVLSKNLRVVAVVETVHKLHTIQQMFGRVLLESQPGFGLRCAVSLMLDSDST